MPYIPVRFRAHCEFCRDAIDIRQPGVYSWTSGWVKNRREGGGNAITLPERHGLYACGSCIELQLSGTKDLQSALF